MFSPNSSLSSFRDYYQNSSDREISEFQRSQKISVGFRNFEISKVLHRWEWKIRERMYWSLFNAFRTINFKMQQSDLKIVRQIKLNSILKTIESKSSKAQRQRKALICWLNQSISQQQLQVQVRKVELTLRFFGKRKQLMMKSILLVKIERRAYSRQIKLSKDKARYIHKLSKALLCVIFRNRINMRLKSGWEAIRQVQLVTNNRNSSNITFFKQKKEKQIYQHKADAKINKLRDFICLHNLFLSKITSRLSYSFRLLRKNFSRKLSTINKEREGDTPQIMRNVVRHMIFLTSKFCSKSKERQTYNQQTIKKIKLKTLVYMLKSKEREVLRGCLFEWRSLARVQNLEIQRQIQRLQAIKRQYIQQS